MPTDLVVAIPAKQSAASQRLPLRSAQTAPAPRAMNSASE